MAPRADGLLTADRAPTLPLMGRRLQGQLSTAGVLTLSLWGLGEVARVRVHGLEGPFVLAPNRIAGRGESGLTLAQSAPALALRGLRLGPLSPLGQGEIVAEQRGEGWLIACGATGAEAARGLALSIPAVGAEAEAYIQRCDLLPAADPLIRSLIIQGVHAALSSIRQDERGGFAGLAAGLAYSVPARTYFRDGYWTLQMLLRLAPKIALAQIDLLAGGVQDDGEAPSGVIVDLSESSKAWERRRSEDASLAAVHRRAGEWWSDHFDSPLFFVLAVGDYVAATGDDEPARRHWPRLAAIFERYRRLSGAEGLPVKPRNDRDWADNVYRDGLVAYDLGLWVGALDALARLGERQDPPLAEEARRTAVSARQAIDPALWCGAWYADYVRPDGSAEDHLALDSLILLRHDAVPEARARLTLEAVRARLESRHNQDQPYGDFGVLCAFPPFARRTDLRGKTAFAYRYHNGGDWPWLDAVYAAERLRRGLGGWRYPLTRWWRSCLEAGWAGPVEYFSPPFGRGSLLQAWSSLPAAVALKYAGEVLAGDPDSPGGARG
ncbi:MAG: GH116 family glycosyl hydrolase [Caulobacterales bacterium]